MRKILAFCALIIALTSCTQFSSEYKQAKQENDSLKLQLKKSEVEMNEMLNILNEIENDIHSIREAEEIISVQKDSELTESKRNQIKSNMLLITETLKKNKQKLSELQEKLNNSELQSTALQKTINRLTNDLNEKSQAIITLQIELGKKDELINELSTQVESLNIDINTLENVNITQNDKIDEQDQALNKVFYCFGTKKELKEQSIISGGGVFKKAKTLEGEFNKEYFIAIDKRHVTAIPLYASKAKIRTNHPEHSFKFFKDQEGHLTLEVTNVKSFWSLSTYLVIEVE